MTYLLNPYMGAAGGGGAGFRTLTIDHTMVSGSTKTNFKIWFDVTHADLKSVGNGGNVVNANHVRLATDTAGTSILNYDIELQDLTTGQLAGWVYISSLSSSVDTVIYVAYNDNGITTYQGNRTSVWTNDTLVYHLGDGSAVSGTDAAGSGFNLTVTNSPAANAGKVYGGATFVVASSQRVARQNSDSSGLCVAGSTFSISLWLNATNFTQYNTALALGTGNVRNFTVGTIVTTGQPYCSFTQGSANFKSVLGTAISTGTWYYVCQTFDGTTERLFVNGVADGTLAVSGSPDGPPLGGDLFNIGDIANTYSAMQVDEVRLSKGVAHDADWWLTEFRNQNTPGTYVTIS